MKSLTKGSKVLQNTSVEQVVLVTAPKVCQGSFVQNLAFEVENYDTVARCTNGVAR